MFYFSFLGNANYLVVKQRKGCKCFNPFLEAVQTWQIFTNATKYLFRAGLDLSFVKERALSAESRSLAEVMNAVNIDPDCFPFACTVNQLELTERDREMRRLESGTKVRKEDKKKRNTWSRVQTERTLNVTGANSNS